MRKARMWPRRLSKPRWTAHFPRSSGTQTSESQVCVPTANDSQPGNHWCHVYSLLAVGSIRPDDLLLRLCDDSKTGPNRPKLSSCALGVAAEHWVSGDAERLEGLTMAMPAALPGCLTVTAPCLEAS
eukprot:scaffold576674_cov19-Prasinocladus_malaysianus.AAC.1